MGPAGDCEGSGGGAGSQHVRFFRAKGCERGAKKRFRVVVRFTRKEWLSSIVSTRGAVDTFERLDIKYNKIIDVPVNDEASGVRAPSEFHPISQDIKSLFYPFHLLSNHGNTIMVSICRQ